MRHLIVKCVIALVVSFLSISPLYADQVTPNDRVSTNLLIRAEPSSGSEVVGRLPTGETAELIEAIPYYYKILYDGVTGYVSKGWAKVVTGSASIAPAAKGRDLIVGSWNIKWFGNSSTDRHNYKRMGDIIARFDVVAIQELRGSRYQDRIDKIIAELAGRNLNYAYVVSDETGYLDNPDKDHATASKKDYLERFAFLWDTSRVDLKSLSGGHQYKFVSLPAINNDTFRQVPIYADFKVKNGNGFDFRIMTTHTVFSKKLNAVRKAEIQFINDWVIAQVRDKDPENNIVAVGDFNANPNGQPHHFDDIVTGTNQYRVLFDEPVIAGESSIRTTILRKANPDAAYLRSPVYDHALVSHETSYALPSNVMTFGAQQLGVVEFDTEEWAESYENPKAIEVAMSDHRPVWFKLNYFAKDLD